MNSSTKLLLLFSLVFFLISFTAFDTKAAPPGNPSQFGEYEWRAYCYNDFSFSQYRGYFTIPGQSYDTRNSYNQYGSPSSASGYNGQSVGSLWHSVSFKRRGFECGEYILNIPGHNMFGSIYVDGTLVFSHSWSTGSVNNIWSGSLGPESTIEYNYQVLLGASYTTLELELQGSETTVWNGSDDNNWFNPANWSLGVPTPTMNARITPAGSGPVINGEVAEVKDLKVKNNADLSIDEDQELKVFGELNIIGDIEADQGIITFASVCPNAEQTFSSNDPITLKKMIKSGNGSLSISGSDITITNELNVLEGSLNTGGKIILGSTSVGTACFGPLLNGASISGEITVQRHIQINTNGWVQLASPVAGRTFANWNDEILTTGFPGSDYPSFSFNNIRMYDESLIGDKDIGLYNASNITNPIEAMTGYQVYLSPGTVNLSVKGIPFTGEHDFNVTFNPSGSEYNDEFSEAHDGWNLVANPYASTIDWDSEAGWEKENLTGAVYVWDATIGQYNLYADGIGVNGGQNLIPSSQAFWVQTNAENPVLKINENAKAMVDAAFKSGETQSALFLTLTGNNSTDEVAFRVYDTDAQPVYQSVQKFYSAEAVPKLGIVGNDELDWAIQSVALNAEGVSIPLHQSFPQAGEYTFSLDAEDYEQINCLFLEDQETGEWIDLRNEDYVFTADQSSLHNRFTLHFGAPLQFTTTPVSCFGESDGMIEWNNNDWIIELEHSDSTNEIETVGNSSGQLPAGHYLADISANGQCEWNGQIELFLEEPAQLTTDEITTNATCHNTANGSTIVEVQGGNTPYQILWEDGNLSPERNHLTAGDYGFLITDNDGCSTSGVVEIEAETTIEAAFELTETEIGVGEVVYVQNTTSGADHISWNLGDGSTPTDDFEPIVQYESAGVYNITLIASKDGCIDVFANEVSVVDLTTSVEEEIDENALAVFSVNGAVLVKTSFDNMRELQVNIYNPLGQQLTSSEKQAAGNTEWYIPVHASGVLIVQIVEKDTGHSISKRIFLD